MDVSRVQSVLAAAKLAKEKNLGRCSGYCCRYDQAKRETVKRIHGGEIGDVTAMHVTFLTGPIWWRGSDPSWSEMEYQMRNWYYFTWLSGDHIVEQHCHNHDKALGATGEPIAASGSAAASADREKYGNIYDHFACTLEFAGGVKLFSACRQMAGCVGDTNDHVIGTRDRPS